MKNLGIALTASLAVLISQNCQASEGPARPVRMIDMSQGSPSVVAEVNRAPLQDDTGDIRSIIPAKSFHSTMPREAKPIHLKGRTFRIQETIR